MAFAPECFGKLSTHVAPRYRLARLCVRSGGGRALVQKKGAVEGEERGDFTPELAHVTPHGPHASGVKTCLDGVPVAFGCAPTQLCAPLPANHHELFYDFFSPSPSTARGGYER